MNIILQHTLHKDKVASTKQKQSMKDLQMYALTDSLFLFWCKVASMVSDLKNQRRELEQRIFNISELGVRVWFKRTV